MKSLIIIAITFLGTLLAKAQGTAPEGLKQEMQKLAFMAGKWRGVAAIRQPNGTLLKVNQEEDVQFKLDGTVLLIEGIGRNTVDNSISFNALAILSFNQQTKEYVFKSYVMDGNQTDAYFKIIEENHFEWGFDLPTKAKIRYDLVLNPQKKLWFEKGEYSPDGNTWFPFIEMTLTKLEK
ncbi:MAG: hypothetical protein HRU69_12910 [Flammeovirgaceae bacterium]|nr:MAG: hypothetical protein HRU69_12910 [Flammeovirgaceae bacterium]